MKISTKLIETFNTESSKPCSSYSNNFIPTPKQTNENVSKLFDNETVAKSTNICQFANYNISDVDLDEICLDEICSEFEMRENHQNNNQNKNNQKNLPMLFKDCTFTSCHFNT